MKFSSVSICKVFSARLSQMWGQILTFPEKKVELDTQHGDHHPTESAVCQCTGRPPQINPTEKKKTLFTLAPLSHMHMSHYAYFTILKMAAVSSTIILPLPPN